MRGEVLEASPKRARHGKSWVIIELLAGIMVGSYVCEHVLKLDISATYYSEIEEDAIWVASALFPEAINLGSVESITNETVTRIVE